MRRKLSAAKSNKMKAGLLALVLVFVHVGQGTTPIFMSTLTAESIPSKYIASAVGLIQGVGEIVGGTLAPVIAGRAADVISPSAPFVIAAGGAIIAGILGFWVIETAPIKLKKMAQMNKTA